MRFHNLQSVNTFSMPRATTQDIILKPTLLSMNHPLPSPALESLLNVRDGGLFINCFVSHE